MDSSALETLVPCLEEFDPTVKEAGTHKTFPSFLAPSFHHKYITTSTPHTSHPLDTHPSSSCIAAWAIGYIAQHTPELAQHVVDAGAVPLLVLCIQEPEISLKRISASSLGDICKHSPELAQAVVDAGAVAYLAPLINHPGTT